MKMTFKNLIAAIVLPAAVFAQVQTSVVPVSTVTYYPTGNGGSYGSVSVSFDVTNKSLVNKDGVIVSASNLFDAEYGVSFKLQTDEYARSRTRIDIVANTVTIDGNIVTVVAAWSAGGNCTQSTSNPAHWNCYPPGIFGDAQISYTQYESSVFDGMTKKITLTQVNTDWMDIHYTINGRLYNYRMTKSGDNFTTVVDAALNNGDVVDYYTTSSVKGIASNSNWDTFTAEGIIPFIMSTSVNAATNTIVLNTQKQVSWVDVHYTIENSGIVYGAYNHRMVVSGTSASYKVPEQDLAGVVNYSFTYYVDGKATNSQTYSNK